MPMIGFLPIPAGEDPLAGFPSDGLVALYKCDERSGDKLYDATGNYPAMTLSTGSALDCVAGDLLFADTTGMLAAFVGQPGVVVMGAEIITPAAVGSGTVHQILTRNTSAAPACSLYLNETTVSGLFRVDATIQTSLDGGAASEISINSGNGFRLIPSSHYQLVVRVDMTAATPHAIFAYRRGTTGVWREFTATGGTAGTHVIAGTGATRLLASYTPANYFKGKIISVFAAAENIPMSTAQTVFDRFGVTAVKNALGTTHARFWDFRIGTGTACRELITNTYETISGTVAWSNSLSGCSQIALRQGLPYYGRAGVLLGGEDGYGAMGGGAVSTSYGNPVGSVNGWTVQATFRTGSHLPASETVIASFYGPDSAGNIPAIGSLPGVHFTLSNAGVILCRMKYIGSSTSDTGNGVVVTAGAGTAVPANGLLTTFTAVCSSAGEVDVYRQHIGEASPTLVTSFTTNTLAIATRADRAAVGQASMDGDVVVGFLGSWSRPLTAAEMAQCHNSAISRMNGQELYVASASTLLGNGTELYPYSDTFPAVRVHQPSQICNWAAGEYSMFDQTASTTASSSNQNITWRGTGVASFQPGAALTDYPVFLEDGSWTFSGITFDANDAAYYAMRVDEGVTSIEFSSCTWKDGHMWVDGVDPGGGSTATGSGLVSRAALNLIYNCTATGNDEHGVYLRIVGESAVDRRFVVDGLTVSDSGEDGLKVTNEEAYGARWVNSVVNRVKVTGGKSQLYLLGMKDSVVSNCLLLDQSVDTSLIAPLLLGKPRAYSGETLVGDYPLENVTVANVTIVNPTATPYAVLVQGDSASGSVTLRNIITSDCANEYSDDTTAGTVSVDYCAGEDSAAPWPSTGSNIPDATIIFTDSGAGDYTLTEESDGYGDGVNMTGLSNEAEVMFDGTTRRPSTGAWNMGAY